MRLLLGPFGARRFVNLCKHNAKIKAISEQIIALGTVLKSNASSNKCLVFKIDRFFDNEVANLRACVCVCARVCASVCRVKYMCMYIVHAYVLIENSNQ